MWDKTVPMSFQRLFHDVLFSYLPRSTHFLAPRLFLSCSTCLHHKMVCWVRQHEEQVILGRLKIVLLHRGVFYFKSRFTFTIYPLNPIRTAATPNEKRRKQKAVKARGRTEEVLKWISDNKNGKIFTECPCFKGKPLTLLNQFLLVINWAVHW